jgi:NhaP-type Na+/H+ or K+/H+ antiporter
MDQVLGKGHLLKQMISLGTVVIWLAFYIFTLLPSDVSHFSQPSCDDRNKFVKLSFLTPLVLIFGAVESHMLGFLAVLIAPLLAIAATWGIGIYRRRRQLWYIANGTRRTPGFWHVWSVCCLLRERSRRTDAEQTGA